MDNERPDSPSPPPRPPTLKFSSYDISKKGEKISGVLTIENFTGELSISRVMMRLQCVESYTFSDGSYHEACHYDWRTEVLHLPPNSTLTLKKGKKKVPFVYLIKGRISRCPPTMRPRDLAPLDGSIEWSLIAWVEVDIANNLARLYKELWDTKIICFNPPTGKEYPYRSLPPSRNRTLLFEDLEIVLDQAPSKIPTGKKTFALSFLLLPLRAKLIHDVTVEIERVTRVKFDNPVNSFVGDKKHLGHLENKMMTEKGTQLHLQIEHRCLPTDWPVGFSTAYIEVSYNLVVTVKGNKTESQRYPVELDSLPVKSCEKNTAKLYTEKSTAQPGKVSGEQAYCSIQ